MELNHDTIYSVIQPTAAFATALRRDGHVADDVDEFWDRSQLNPKNRIDSLEFPEKPLWHVDGCTGLGTQYFARPLFLGDVPPMRFDVFIPERFIEDSAVTRHLLDLDAAFLPRDSVQVQRLGITRYIVRVLDAWTRRACRRSPAAVAVMYSELPYGTKIIFESLNFDVHRVTITLAEGHDVERQLLSPSKLANMFGTSVEELPPLMNLRRLAVLGQMQDSVCLVRVREGEGHSDKVWILKALTSGFKYLYTELRNLLRMSPHPNVMARPEYLVTKHCCFGAKTGVVGFLLEFHSGGGLRDTLPLLQMHGKLHIQRQMRWALQLTSALQHVRDCGIYYPDLRADNMVLTSADDLVMVDFEQRGVWCEFAAPEINAIDYVRMLANDDGDASGAIPPSTRERYATLMSSMLPTWQDLEDTEEYDGGRLDSSVPAGYNVPWLCLSRREQEAAEVYMLGRVLWCIFEGQCAPQRAAVWQSYRREPDLEFPAYRRTPPALRILIDACTRGRRGMLSALVARRASKLVLRRPAGEGHEAAENADEVVRAAREWWTAEVAESEQYLRMRAERKAQGRWDENYYARPSMRDVMASLREIRDSLGMAS